MSHVTCYHRTSSNDVVCHMWPMDGTLLNPGLVLPTARLTYIAGLSSCPSQWSSTLTVSLNLAWSLFLSRWYYITTTSISLPSNYSKCSCKYLQTLAASPSEGKLIISLPWVVPQSDPKAPSRHPSPQKEPKSISLGGSALGKKILCFGASFRAWWILKTQRPWGRDS